MNRRLPGLVAFALLFSLHACSQESSASPAKASPASKEGAASVTPAVATVLAAADAKDGKTDHVVSKCAGCALAMDGKSDMSLEVGDYTMHFCKDECHDRFAEDPEKEILALEIK